jgi:DNA-binding IclR family transcriptional regulator
VSSSVTRAARILSLVAHAERPMTLTQIADDLEIPKSTAHGILRDLAGEGFIEVLDPPGYAIGLRAFEVGAAHLRRSSTVGVVAPELVKLTRSLGVTSHYAVLDGADAVYLCKEDPPGLGVQLASSVGARLPAHLTAVGKACLAWTPDEELPDHLPRGLARRRDALDAELLRARAEGHTVDDGATSSGIQCAAAPVFGHSRCLGAIGVSYLRGGSLPVAEVVAQVLAAAARVSTVLGGEARRWA